MMVILMKTIYISLNIILHFLFLFCSSSVIWATFTSLVKNKRYKKILKYSYFFDSFSKPKFKSDTIKCI